MEHNFILNRLWKQYTTQNPIVQQVYDLFISEGEAVVNDHIAFRTFRNPVVGVDVLATPFLRSGYIEKGEYHFPQKKLFARHFEHPEDPTAPRIFISELLVGEFSPELQQVVRQWIHSVPECLIGSENILFAGNVSEIPSWETYRKLLSESEYAAWLYVNGFRANHFTVSVNHLKKYDSIEKVNALLKQNGFLLNDSSGEIQGKPEDLLEQSSIKAGLIPFRFLEGTYEIPGSYYEFARRYPGPDGTLYSGFIARSADKIFESTNFYQK